MLVGSNVKETSLSKAEPHSIKSVGLCSGLQRIWKVSEVGGVQALQQESEEPD